MQKLLSLKNWFIQSSLLIKIIFLVIILGVGYLGYTKFVKKSSTTQSQYQTATAEKGTIVVTVSSSGSVSSANSGSVTTQASGVVTKILVKNGQQVKTGQQIATFDLDQTSKQKYAAATASYQSAKNNLASAQSQLYTLQSQMFVANQKFVTGAGSETAGDSTADPNYIEQNADWLAAEQKYIQQQSVIAQAQTSVSAAALALQQVSPTVTAPISGTVTGLSLQIGSVLGSASDSNGNSTAQKIASIQTTAAPTVTVNLTQVDIPTIKVGDKATLTFDAFSDKTYTGEVVSIDTIGSVSSGVTTYPAVIKLDTASSDIFSNMTATANIITNSKADVLLVPSSAVTTLNGESTVRILKNGEVSQVPVTTGLSSSTQVEIDSGLSEGDTVITGSAASATGASSVSTTTSPFSTFGGARSGGAARGNVTFVRGG